MRVEDVHVTPRESQVLVLTGLGLTLPEVARELGMSERTARHHSDTLREKFSVQHRRELVPIGQKWAEA